MTPTEAGQIEHQTEAAALAARLSGGGLYVRTALLLLPPHWLGREGEVAVRLNLSHVSYPTWKTAQLRSDQAFLMYSAERLITELGEICAEKHAHGTLLVSAFDLPLSALKAPERRKFWGFLQGTFIKRPRALLLTFPHEAEFLLPDESDLTRWQSEGRLSRWPD